MTTETTTDITAHRRLGTLLRRSRSDVVHKEILVAEQNGARLVRVDGKLVCRCPFACLAAYEPCEFAP